MPSTSFPPADNMPPRILLLGLPLLAACSGMPDASSLLSPYRIDVRQGNFVSQEMVAKLKPGMSRDQVRFVLGTPLIADIFHANRWDYIYRFQPGRGEAQERRLAVYFEDGKLARVGGDVVAEAGGDSAAPASAARVIDVPAHPGKD